MVSFKSYFVASSVAFVFVCYQISQKAGVVDAETVLQALFSSATKTLVIVNQIAIMLAAIFFGYVKLFFNELRDVEVKELKELLINFALFKFVMILNTFEPHFDEMAIWGVWFCLVALVHLASTLAMSRFRYLSVFVNTAPRRQISTVLAQGVCTVAASTLLFTAIMLPHLDWSTRLIIIPDCLMIILLALRTIANYCIQVYDLQQQDWTNRTVVSFYTEFLFDVVTMSLTLAHYLHLWFVVGISFTVLEFILFFNVRSVYLKLRKYVCLACMLPAGVTCKMRRRISDYQFYARLNRDLEQLFPPATAEEVAGDSCAICLEDMDTEGPNVARKLPCSHCFHSVCLRQWLARVDSHSRTCPICRADAYGERAGQQASPQTAPGAEQPPQAQVQRNLAEGMTWGDNNFGLQQRLFQWNAGGLGLFAQVSFGRDRRAGGAGAAMARMFQPPAVSEASVDRVMEMFPHLDRNVVRQLMQQTGGRLDAVIEAALEGRIPFAPQPEPQHTAAPAPPSTQQQTATTQSTAEEESDGEEPDADFMQSAVEAVGSDDLIALYNERKARMVKYARKMARRKREQKESANAAVTVQWSDSIPPSDDSEIHIQSSEEAKQEANERDRRPTAEPTAEERRAATLAAIRRRQQTRSEDTE